MKLFNFLFCLCFSFQTIWTGANATTIPTDILKKVVQDYNSLSQANRFKHFHTIMKSWPKADQAKMEKILSQHKGIILPDIVEVNGRIQFTHQQKTLNLKLIDKNRIEMLGKELDFSPENVSQTLDLLSKMEMPKEVTLMDFILPSAYANIGELVLLIGIIVGLLSGFLFEVAGTLGNEMDKVRLDAKYKELMLKCEEGKRKIKAAGSLGEKDLKFLDAEIEKNLRVSTDARFLARGLKKGETKPSYVQKAEKAIACFEELQGSLFDIQYGPDRNAGKALAPAPAGRRTDKSATGVRE